MNRVNFREFRFRRSVYLAAITAVALAMLVLPSTAFAGTQGWGEGGGSSSPEPSDLAPSMRSDEAYLERYSFSADLDNGGHIGFDFTISNLGWGDHKGGVTVRVKWPGQGKYEYRKKKKKGNYNASKSTMFLDIANTSVTAVGSDEIQPKHTGDVDVHITFDNRIPL